MASLVEAQSCEKCLRTKAFAARFILNIGAVGKEWLDRAALTTGRKRDSVKLIK